MIGLPFPVETTLTIAGIGVSNGTFSFLPLFISAVLGNMIGATIAYYIGSKVGSSVLIKYGKYVGVTDKRLKVAERMLLQYRIPVFFLSKFITGVRVFVPYLSGINQFSFKLFFIYNALATMFWAAIFIFMGRWIHIYWMKYHTYLSKGWLVSLISMAIIAAVGLLVWSRVKKHRRQLGNV
ncbi:DedA family protein [Cohnella sp. WQ 127256]|uniref:DedA family protein n=1 Tax=Cohnella sp. WQ 127256 TaxID=2938790 RepID=UPI002118CC2C|nr:DedA family protein [Cohnella sp. WQ 127256]